MKKTMKMKMERVIEVAQTHIEAVKEEVADHLEHTPHVGQMLHEDLGGAGQALHDLPGRLPAVVQYVLVIGGLILVGVCWVNP